MSIAQIAKAIDALGVNKRISDAFTQIEAVSTDLSDQINTVANDNTTAINQVSSDLSIQMGQLSSNLSTEISTVAASISTFGSDLGQQISNVDQLASSANSNAITAINTADAAAQSAATANSTASGANATANSALTIANTAADNANTALSTANAAASDASGVLSIANDASDAASNAVTTANQAASLASAAIDAANAAISNIVQPSAGLTVSGTTTRTLALADDTAAVEAISGTGIAVRTGTNTWTVRLVAGTQDKITVTNGDGGTGDITVTIANTYAGQSSIVTVGTLTTGVWNATAIGTIYGGTNITSWTTGDLPYASATNVLSKLAGVATGNALVSGGIGVAPSWGKIGLSTHVSGNLPVTNLNSGTNASGTTFWAGDGTWKSISSSASLTSGRIGFGDGSNLLSGSTAFTYNDSTHTLQIGAGTGLSTFRTPNASSGADAASLTIKTGDANSGVVGAGTLRLEGGAGAGTSNAGSLEFVAGSITGSGNGGSITFDAGNSTSGAKGTVIWKIAGVTIGTLTANGLQSTTFEPTGSTGPANGMYLKSAGVVGLAANNTAAFMYGSNAFVSQTANARDVGELATPMRDIFSANAVTVTSDTRTKTDIEDSALGLNFINLLRSVSYRKIVGQISVSDDGLNTETEVPGVRRHYGLLSQQVKQSLDTLNVGDFAGWCLADPNDPESQQALRYEQFISPLIKAAQEIDDKVEAQEVRIQQLESQMQQLLSLLQ